jgi:hypothetical protein
MDWRTAGVGAPCKRDKAGTEALAQTLSGRIEFASEQVNVAKASVPDGANRADEAPATLVEGLDGGLSRPIQTGGIIQVGLGV